MASSHGIKRRKARADWSQRVGWSNLQFQRRQPFLYNAGIPTKIDAQQAIAHNKVMVLDGETVVTGFFKKTNLAVAET